MNGIHKILALLAILTFTLEAKTQELNCEISVMAPQINNIDASVFETMESTIREFMNGRKWTKDYFDFDERIEVSMQITISEAPSQTQFRGSIQIQSSRPVYNSDYKTSVFAINDQNVDITFLPNSILQFSLDQHRDNLSSLLGFYAYMIIGFDYDTFSLEGGTPYFLNAQTVVANASNSASQGWKASDGPKSRFSYVENQLSQTFKPLRKCLYRYHRHGWDKTYDGLEGARLEMSNALLDLRSIHKIRPSSFNLQMFFFSKSDEIVNLFTPSPQEERLRLYNLLTSVDPGNIGKYEKMMN